MQFQQVRFMEFILQVFILVAKLGGWLADRHIGQQKAILYGGFIIMIGHFLLAFTNIETFILV